MVDYIDLQVNGYLGVEFSVPTLTPVEIQKVVDAQRAAGTSCFLSTMVTSPLETYQRNLPMLADWIEQQGGTTALMGIHLEGPFISPQPGVVGAHTPEYVQTPDVDTLARLLDWGRGHVRMLTVAAELPGIEQLIRYATDHGVIVSIGHSWYDEDDLKRGVDAGVKTMTHVGNGLPNMVHRHHNPMWAAMANDDLIAMVIADGHHLPASLLKAMVRIKTPERIIVVTDAAPVAGLAPGRYDVLGNTAVLEPSGLLHNPEKQCLVGSTATMQDCADFLSTVDTYTNDEMKAMLRENALRLLGHPSMQA